MGSVEEKQKLLEGMRLLKEVHDQNGKFICFVDDELC